MVRDLVIYGLGGVKKDGLSGLREDGEKCGRVNKKKMKRGLCLYKYPFCYKMAEFE